jgi:hypothetical protein
MGAIDYNPAPSTFRDAMSLKDKPQWWLSMYSEFEKNA